MFAPRKIASILVALFVLGTSGRLWAGEAVPFTLRGTAVIIHFDPMTGVAINDCVGRGTQVGRWTGIAIVQFAPDSSSVGRLTVVAANGDTIDIFAEAKTVNPTTDEGSYEIVGGTGRFEEACGTGTFVSRFNPDGTRSIAFDGVIIRP